MVKRPEPPKAERLSSLYEFLRRVPEYRKARGIRHQLATIFAIALAAKLAGVRGVVAIGEFASRLTLSPVGGGAGVLEPEQGALRRGERRKPHPAGRPGFLRVDSVHQGDLDGEKGLYEINLVDEVTPYEFVAAVEGISERFPVPALEGSIEAFPFIIRGFHADNGSEYINHRVAALLRKLHVEEFTKSRPRRSSDNALVESKNASVARRYLGHDHIPRHHAALVNDFLRDVLALFLNYHRPCHFPVETTDAKGRIRKTYPFDKVTTPYLKLKSLDGAALSLRTGVTFEQLDQQALALHDLAAATAVNEALVALFAEIRRRDASVA